MTAFQWLSGAGGWIKAAPKRSAGWIGGRAKGTAAIVKAWWQYNRLWFAIPLLIAVGLAWYAFTQEETIHDWFEDCQAILTSLVIVVGGGWFLERRLHFPRAEISHAIATVRRDDRTTLLIQTRVTNKSDLKIKLIAGQYEVQTVPGSSEPLKCGPLFLDDPREVEGGESEEVWQEIELPPNVEHIRVYTCIRNEFRSDNTHWDKSTYYWIREERSLG